MGEDEKQQRLSPRDKKIVVEIIETWDGMPTWEDVVETTKMKIGFCPRRNALVRHKIIKDAWEAKKEDTGTSGAGRKKSKLLMKCEEDKEKLKKKVANLEKINAELVDKFLRWQYNATYRATSGRMTEADLNKPIPKPSQTTTKKKKS